LSVHLVVPAFVLRNPESHFIRKHSRGQPVEKERDEKRRRINYNAESRATVNGASGGRKQDEPEIMG
jgi:hypothetical protein